jgi:uncharacterized damage-inducible protein DinB
MTISQALLPEYDQEMANTRKTLERVPDDKFGWKPHEKSFAMGPLAVHLATMPGWVVETVSRDELDYAPPGGEPMQMPTAENRQQLLKLFDESVSKGRAALAGASDEHLMKPWKLLAGGKEVLTMPRVAVIRTFVMNHNVHHRAQLGVYLRLNNIPVPSIYGPSADETGM